MNTYNPMDLTGKVILITGASSGIGRAIALECAELGGRCIITGRNEERLAETLHAMKGEGHRWLSADLTVSDDVSSLADELPKLDGVSLNAGFEKMILCSRAKQKDVEALFAVHFFSVVNIVSQILKKQKLNPQASMVMMSSVSAFNHVLGNGFYGAAKASLSHYALDLAREFRGKGYRFNTVRPGMIDTPLTQGHVSEEFKQEMLKSFLYGRYGKPEEVAHLVAFLLSDASVWISGSEFTIDGGSTIM